MVGDTGDKKQTLFLHKFFIDDYLKHSQRKVLYT